MTGRAFAIVFAILAVLAPLHAQAEEKARLTLLHVNDVYEFAVKDNGLGGFGVLAALVREQEKAGNPVLVTFGGDLLSPSLLSGITKGHHMVDLMNALGADLAVPGNHEFDFGAANFAEAVKGSEFPWLGANVLDGAGQPYGGMGDRVIREVGPFKVGFFGVLTEETAILSSPGNGVVFRPALEAASKQVGALKSEGADVVVALTHLDFDADLEVAGLEGIDVVLGGHDHDAYTFYDGDTLVQKSGFDAEYLAVIHLDLERVQDGKDSKVAVRPQWSMVPVAGVAKDAEVQALVEKYKKQLSAEMDQPIGKTPIDLDSRRSVIRSGEASMGNLVADAMRWSTGADICLTNGGGIRADKLYKAGSVLTRKDIFAELPFANVAILLELDGRGIRSALERGVAKVEGKSGQFLQVSGLRFEYDPDQPAGRRVLSVMVGDKPLDDAATYKVATNDYLGDGGNGYVEFAEANHLIDKSAATLMATIVMHYVEEVGTAGAEVSGRIVAR